MYATERGRLLRRKQRMLSFWPTVTDGTDPGPRHPYRKLLDSDHRPARVALRLKATRVRREEKWIGAKLAKLLLCSRSNVEMKVAGTLPWRKSKDNEQDLRHR